MGWGIAGGLLELDNFGTREGPEGQENGPSWGESPLTQGLGLEIRRELY